MNKTLITSLIFGGVIFGIFGAANASLVGDTVEVLLSLSLFSETLRGSHKHCRSRRTK